MAENARKIAIIGASYLQLPLLEKAKSMGLETHVFAWKCGDIGETVADHFHPISIVEKEKILEECQKIGISGICSIASDLAVITVNYVAEKMGLIGNGISDSLITTNKYHMKRAFEENNIPAARCILVSKNDIPDLSEFTYPLIVKPTDRSGSRGVTRLNSPDESIEEAISRAVDQSFEKKALVEEYIFGDEYSVECVSFRGEHEFLAMTKKYTTGDPHYIEKGHLEPAPIDETTKEKVIRIIFSALDALGIQNGASHSEVKICGEDIKVIEIGARMGGDMIGSSLVQLSTGYDFVKAVIDISLGDRPQKPDLNSEQRYAAIRYIIDDEEVKILENLKNEASDLLYASDLDWADDGPVVDSSSRKGYFILTSDSMERLLPYLPE